jgi:hypothetical protein
MVICARCERDAPSGAWTLDNGWLTMMDESGRDFAVVCPDCLTDEEREEVRKALAAERGPSA